MLFRILLSAVTLFGGHVLNRRLDRILHLFGMLALLGIAYSTLPSLVFRHSETFELSQLFNVSALALISIALISAVWTWKDAKATDSSPLSVGSRVAGVIVSLFGFMMIVFTTLVLVSPIGPRGPAMQVAHESSLRSTLRMHNAIANLGGDIDYSELKRPPTGPHALRGRIVMAGEPVVSARGEVILNGVFRSEIVTNARGEFELLLPAGPWSMNQVTLTSWDDAPEGPALLLFSEHEPLRGTGYYSRMSPEESPVRIDLPMRADLELPTFELRPSIGLHWPPAGEGDPTDPSDAPIANVATDAISWRAVPDAAEYEIQVQSVERERGTMQTRTILLRRANSTELALADLPQQPRTSAEPSEYSVVVYAFDANGKLLSQSLEGFDYHAFRLDGETRLAEEKVYRSPAPGDGTQHLRNMERLSLVHSLLEYKQVDAARAILKEVTGDAPPGRKAAMQGAIEALTGNCAAAIPLLDQADKEGGLGCAPAKYRAMCATPR